MDVEHLYFRSTIKELSKFFTEMQQIADLLFEICDHFKLPQTGDIHPLARTLQFIQLQISITAEAFSDWLSKIKSWSDDLGEQSLSEFSKSIDDLVTELLLVVQKFIHDQADTEKNISTNSEDGEEVENQSLCSCTVQFSSYSSVKGVILNEVLNLVLLLHFM